MNNEEYCKYKKYCEFLNEITNLYGFGENMEIVYYVKQLQEKVLLSKPVIGKKKVFSKTIMKDRDDAAKKRFIKIWETRFLEFCDSEFPGKFTPANQKMIKNLIKRLEEFYMTIDDMLSWFFEKHLIKNPKMANPPALAYFFSEHVVTTFLFDHKDHINNIKKKKKDNDEEKALYERAAYLYKKNPDNENIQTYIKRHQERMITTRQLRSRLDKVEEAMKNGN